MKNKEKRKSFYYCVNCGIEFDDFREPLCDNCFDLIYGDEISYQVNEALKEQALGFAVRDKQKALIARDVKLWEVENKKKD